MSALSGIRILVRTSRPWPGRVAWAVGAWLAVVAFGAVGGQAASVPQVAAVVLAVAMLAWYVLDHAALHAVTQWPVSDRYRSRLQRGQDFRVTHLATRLRAANERGEGRDSLVDDLHGQLTTIIRERLHSKHGLVLEEEPRWSQGVMPPELWDFMMRMPDPELYRADTLSAVLERIERW